MKKKFKPQVVKINSFNRPGVVPTKEEVGAAAREAVLPDIRKILNQISERITLLYVENAKTAVILNSLAELLIEKGMISKKELQERVSKNQAITEENYRKVLKEKGKDLQPEDSPLEPEAQTVCEKTPKEDEDADTLQRENGEGTDGVLVQGGQAQSG